MIEVFFMLFCIILSNATYQDVPSNPILTFILFLISETRQSISNFKNIDLRVSLPKVKLKANVVI